MVERRRLGNRGPEVSVVGIGCNNFGMKLDRAASEAVVRAALDAGVTHFDTAEMYGGGESEAHLGAALGADRDAAFIATKFLPRPEGEPYEPGALARRIREGCETSLRRLGTDRIDLYYQHYPDPVAPAEEALEALASLVAEGKVLNVGVSNVTPAQLSAASTLAVAAQVEWNLLAPEVEAEVVPAAAATDVGIIPYFPLASGLLTGKYRRDQPFPAGSRLEAMSFFASIATPENFDRVERLEAFATERGHTILELAVSWLLAQATVGSVICGATSPGQVHANVAAAAWVLEADDLAVVEGCR